MKSSNKWLDAITVLFSLIVIGLAFNWLFSSGLFDFRPADGTNVTWYLVRSSGLVAYLLLMASMIWGLFISSKFVRDWSPGMVSLTLHSTVSWLALLMSIVHAGLLLFDDYLTYTLRDLVVPFGGPYRPFWVGLGIVGFWLIVVVSISFPVRKMMGYKRWLWLHYTSYVAFGMVAAHGVFAGTDGGNIGFRLLTLIGIIAIGTLVSARSEERQNRRMPAREMEMVEV